MTTNNLNAEALVTNNSPKMENNIKLLNKSIDTFVTKTISFITNMKEKNVPKEVIQNVIGNFMAQNVVSQIKIENDFEEREIPEGQEFVMLEFKKVGASLKKVLSMIIRESDKLSEEDNIKFLDNINNLFQEKISNSLPKIMETMNVEVEQECSKDEIDKPMIITESSVLSDLKEFIRNSEETNPVKIFQSSLEKAINQGVTITPRLIVVVTNEIDKKVSSSTIKETSVVVSVEGDEEKVQKDTVASATVEEDDEDKIKKEIESLELRLKKIQESKVKPQPVKRFTTSGIRMINSLEELMALA